MRALIQRTFKSALSVDGKLISEIPSGLTIFLGIEKGDTEEQADYFARKVAKLRVFRDENDKMNLDIKQAGGEILLVSQFSLAGTLGKGTGVVWYGFYAITNGVKWFYVAAGSKTGWVSSAYLK